MHGGQKNSIRRTAVGFLGLLTLLILGCQGERRETPTKGSVSVLVAESISPMMEAEQKQFEELYPDAHVHLRTTTAREAIAELFNDSISIVASSRPLNAEEREVATKANLKIQEYKIAYDGVGVIVNNGNPVTKLRTTQLDSMFSGAVRDWRGVAGRQFGGPIGLCFPDVNTGTFETFAMTILHGGKAAAPEKLVMNSAEMIAYVAANVRSIGIVGAGWLGVDENKNKVKVLALNDPNAPDSLGTRSDYYSPHQAYLYQRYYPLTTDVYILSRADGYGVAAGFTAFITSAPGQKIVVQCGLAPATMPVRLVELTHRSITQ